MQKKVTCSDASTDPRTVLLLNFYLNSSGMMVQVEPYLYSSTPKSKEGHQLQIQNQKNILRYCGKVIENIVKNASNKQICCLDFLMNDMKKSSLKDALNIEKVYDDNRIAGFDVLCIQD